MMKLNKNYSKYLLPYDEKKVKEISQDQNSIFINSTEKLIKLINEALDNPKSIKKLRLGVIPKNIIKRIKNEILDIKKDKINTIIKNSIDYDLTINEASIRHIKKESLSNKDVINFILLLDKLICDFDTIRYSIYSRNQHALRLKKETSCGTYIAVLIISNGKRSIRIQTIFLDKKDCFKKKETFLHRLMIKIPKLHIFDEMKD